MNKSSTLWFLIGCVIGTAGAQNISSDQYFLCGNGTTVKIAQQASSQITLSYGSETWQLRQTRSADGVRYADGQQVWWSKGNVAFFSPDSLPPSLTCQPTPATQLGRTTVVNPQEETNAWSPVNLSLGDFVTVRLPL